MSSIALPLQPPSRSFRLRALIDDLILFGRLLLEALQNDPASEIATSIISRFSGSGIAAVIARITRGLMLADALGRRVQREAKRIDNPPLPRLDAPRTSTARKRKPRLLTDDDAALLARMPTAEEIAANIRTRPIGDVLGDIARDLGLNQDDPLWMQIYGDILKSHCITGLHHLTQPRRKPGNQQRRKRRPPTARATTPIPPQPVPVPASPPPEPRVRPPPDLQWQWVPVPVFHKQARTRSFRGNLLSSVFSPTPGANPAALGQAQSRKLNRS